MSLARPPITAIAAVGLIAVHLTACGPPNVDIRVLSGLPRVARAPAAEADRGVLAAERELKTARTAVQSTESELSEAQAGLAKVQQQGGDTIFRQTQVAYLGRVVALRIARSKASEQRLELARARFELAKAQVADDNSVPEATDLDLNEFREAVEVAATAVSEADKAAETVGSQVSILKRAMHAARVANMRTTGGAK